MRASDEAASPNDRTILASVSGSSTGWVTMHSDTRLSRTISTESRAVEVGSGEQLPPRASDQVLTTPFEHPVRTAPRQEAGKNGPVASEMVRAEKRMEQALSINATNDVVSPGRPPGAKEATAGHGGPDDQQQVEQSLPENPPVLECLITKAMRLIGCSDDGMTEMRYGSWILPSESKTWSSSGSGLGLPLRAGACGIDAKEQTLGATSSAGRRRIGKGAGAAELLQ